ncbi:hypothetical protein D3C74_321050 [compost metagenome]
MDYFFCYNSNLAKFLRFTKGIPSILKAKHHKTDRVFYLFLQNEKLAEAIKEYKTI